MKLPNERTHSSESARRRLPEPAPLNLSVEAKASSDDVGANAESLPGIERRPEGGDGVFDAPSMSRSIGRRRLAVTKASDLIGDTDGPRLPAAGTIDGPAEFEDEWDRYGQLAGSVAGAEPGAVFWKEKRRSSRLASLNSRLGSRAELLRRSSLLVAGVASLMLIGVLVLPIGGSTSSGPVALGAGSVDDLDRAEDGTFDPASARATTGSADQGEAAEHRRDRVGDLALTDDQADDEADDQDRAPGSIDSADSADSDGDPAPAVEPESTSTTAGTEPAPQSTAKSGSTPEPAPVVKDEPVTAPSSPTTAKAKATAKATTTTTEAPTTSTTAKATTTTEAPTTSTTAEATTTTAAPTTSTTAEPTTTEAPTTSTTAEPAKTTRAPTTATTAKATTAAPTTSTTAEATTTSQATTTSEEVTTTTAESPPTTESVTSIAESVTTIAESTPSAGEPAADPSDGQTSSETVPDSTDPGVIVEASVDQVGAL